VAAPGEGRPSSCAEEGGALLGRENRCLVCIRRSSVDARWSERVSERAVSGDRPRSSESASRVWELGEPSRVRHMCERSGLTTEERAELMKLRRENRTLAMENEILKRAAAYFARENVLSK
jgi:transposase